MQTSLSLRERKRTDTFRSIHEAAAELVLDRGLVNVTVDEIVERAGVSQRTFFNYFPTKEDAVVGLRTPELTDEMLQSFRTQVSSDLLSSAVELLAAVIRTALVPGDDPVRRKELTAEYPELRRRFMLRIADAERLALQVIEDQPESLPNTEEAARALIALAGAVIRFSYQSQPGSVTSDDQATLHHGIDTFREVLRTAL